MQSIAAGSVLNLMAPPGFYCGIRSEKHKPKFGRYVFSVVTQSGHRTRELRHIVLSVSPIRLSACMSTDLLPTLISTDHLTEG